MSIDVNNLEETKLKKWSKVHKIIEGIDYKWCSRCEEYHPATIEYFYKNNSSRIDGLNPYCIKSTKEQVKQWRNDNPDKVRELSRKQDSSQDRIEYKREHAKRPESKALQKEWRESEKGKQYMSSFNKERNKNKKHEISKKEWERCKGYFNNECAYCGLSITEKFQ